MTLRLPQHVRLLVSLVARSLLAVALTFIGFSNGAAAQSSDSAAGPDPREIPVPPIKTAMGDLPGVNDLPVRTEMPDIMTMNDGTKVTSIAQWEKRREEIKRILEYYAVGQMPPPPGNVVDRLIQSQVVLDGKVQYRLVQLNFGPDQKLELFIGIFTPTDGKGPYPAIIRQGGEPPGGPQLPQSPPGPNQGRGEDILLIVGRPTDGGTTRPSAARSRPLYTATAESIARGSSDVFRRGYALVLYNDNDCAEDTTLREADGSFTFRHTRFYPAYPGYDWGILAGWAWGASRVADYLQTDLSIDGSKLIITGWSRTGKSSMIAAAFDERLMAAPGVTGGGGIGAYRFAGADGSESLDIMQKKYPNWFSPHLHEFWGHKDKLPFDEHWFLALCAPRPFIALEGDADTISLPDAVEHSIRAAWPAYELFGAKDHLGVHYSHHAHAFTAEDWTALMDFADKNLRGMPVAESFDHFLTQDQRTAARSSMRPSPRPSTRPATASAPAIP